MVLPFESPLREHGWDALREASRFFTGEGTVHDTLRGVTDRLHALGIPYAVLGGMALVVHGYRRLTVDVDILLTPEGWARASHELVGSGYTACEGGRRSLRDDSTGVKVDVLLTGRWPGDGRPKPVSFPHPLAKRLEVGGIGYVALPTLVELKLASGTSNRARLRDLADVQELIKALRLPAGFASEHDSSVRAKFQELREGAEQDDSEY